MGEVSTIGLDIAKSVFQIHGVDRDGEVAIRKRVSRAKLLEFFAAVIAICPNCIGFKFARTTNPQINSCGFESHSFKCKWCVS